MARDTVTTRRTARAAKRVKCKRRALGASGRITRFSYRSRKRALLHLRNATCYRCFVVLTFPGTIDDDRLAKSALDRFALWAIRKGVSLFWKIEFRDRRPHFHILATGQLAESEVSRVWADIIGAQYVKVYSEPIVDLDRAINYVIKPCDDTQNLVPEGYRHMGRFWGTRGLDARPEVLFEAIGDASRIAPLERAVRAVDKSARRRRGDPPVADHGRAGRTFYDQGGSAIAAPLTNLANSIREQSK